MASISTVGSPIDLSGPTFIVVSGASQGIGRALASEISQVVGPNSLILLLARNSKELAITASLCESPNIKVCCKSLDLAVASAKDMNNAFLESLAGRQVKDFTTNIIFHNVGSLGNLSVRTKGMENVLEMRDYFDLNVFNVITLNTQFLKLCSGFEDKVVIVNITSLCALKPMSGMAYYCSGKAAREMYFKVLAEELPETRVLNYSPGPVETAMIDYILETAVNTKLQEVFASFKNDQKLLKAEVTAKKCIKVLLCGKFTPGEHVDYFDDE